MAYQPFNYQPTFQPMQQQMQQQIPMGYFTPPMQQQIQQQNQSNGKIVDSIEMVKFTDIPMDGNSYYFPKADGTEIYSKRWLANGSTEINTYVKVDVNSPEEEKEHFDFNLMQNNIMDKLNSLEEKLSKINPSKPVAKVKEG